MDVTGTAVEIGAMTPSVDHYTLLSRAVARLNSDSYQARGALYDRAYEALLHRMAAADPPWSDAEIADEERAFRHAIRRIEFGDGEDQEPAPAASYIAPEPTLPRDLHRQEVGQEVENDMRKSKRRPVFGRVVRRLMFAAVVIGIGALGYAYVTGDVELPLLTTLAGEGVVQGKPADTASQQAFLIDGPTDDPNATKAVGKATWRTRSESVVGQPTPMTVLQVDLEIPQRRFAMKMSMRPEPPGGAMSHLVELRFLREDQQPDPDIVDIAGIVVKTADNERLIGLAGGGVKVTPGVFLFGLSGEAGDRERNMRSLRELTWFDIPLTYRNGSKGVLAVEKGAAGERAFKEALAQWGQ